MVWAMGTAPRTLSRPPADGITERVDPISCLDERTLSQASETGTPGPGRYLEVQGAGRTLLIPIGSDVIHIGRGLSADLRLDESSVSRRHAILVPRVVGRPRARRPQLERHVRQRPPGPAGRPQRRRRDRRRARRAALPRDLSGPRRGQPRLHVRFTGRVDSRCYDPRGPRGVFRLPSPLRGGKGSWEGA